MKNLATGLLILCAASITMAASTIDGKWISERQVGDSDGKTYGHTSTFTLKSDGSSVTGTVVATSEAPWMRATTGKAFDIEGGSVDGDKFTFKLVYRDERGERTSVYQGTFDGDQMKGVVKFRGIGQTWTFDATRAKP